MHICEVVGVEVFLCSRCEGSGVFVRIAVLRWVVWCEGSGVFVRIVVLRWVVWCDYVGVV